METYQVKVHTNGDKYWCQNDKLHRLDGPAVEYADGDKYWCQNGQLHRLDGPAVEYADGAKQWYQNGQLHRLDGPAIEYTDGDKHWYIKGQFLTEAEFLTRTQPPKPDCSGKTVVIDGITYKLEKT